jgi:hypothetical protein
MDYKFYQTKNPKWTRNTCIDFKMRNISNLEFVDYSIMLINKCKAWKR